MPTPTEDAIAKIILANNLLQLPDEEVRSLSTTLSQCSGEKEVRDWCNTLMVADADVELILKAIKAKPSASTPTPAPAATSSSSALPALPSNAPRTTAGAMNIVTSKPKKRGTNANALKKDNTDSRGLVGGKFFECGCFATEHDYVANCLNCGRIFCAQELPTAVGGTYMAQAAGVSAETTMCYFCGMPPTENVAEGLQVTSGGASAQAQQTNLEDAIERRDKLLAFASDKKRRTTVVDDQLMGAMVTTGQSMTWLSDQEMEKAEDLERKQRVANLHKSSGIFKVHLDIVNQAVCLGAVPSKEEEKPAAEEQPAAEQDEDEEEDAQRIEPMPKMLQRIWYAGDTTAAREDGPKTSAHRTAKSSVRIQNDYYADDQLQYSIQLQEKARAPPAPTEVSVPEPEPTPVSSTLSLQEQQVLALKMAEDGGMCMTLHQPWASLLVAGIMRHEGRGWSSDFKGRLWIHAAAAKPIGVEEVEAHFKQFVGDDVQFPKQYPTSCLLGCVTVTDVIPQEEYQARFPPEQRQSMGTSEHIFICTKAKKLPFALPMDGKHKIYRMDKKLWAAAKKQFGEA